MADTDSTRFFPAAVLAEVPPGTVKLVTVQNREILLCHTNGRVFAVINRCSHADARLECGMMKAGWIACPLHGARFDLATGKPKNPPAKQPIEIFAVRMCGDKIEVAV